MLRNTVDGIQRYRAVATSGSEFIAVGEDGVILTSKDGVNWLPEEGTNYYSVNDIVWGTDEFVAVGSGGNVLRFLRTQYQSDGRTTSYLGNSYPLNGIAFNGSNYMTVGNNGISYRSWGATPDSWTPVTTGVTKHLYGVAWTGSYWVAVGQDGTILRASSSSSWTAMTSPTTDDLRKIAVGSTTVAAVGERGVVVTSPKLGNSWTRRQHSTLYNWWDVAWDGTKFLAAADLGHVFSSADGITWNSQPRAVGANLYGIAVGSQRTVVVGDDAVVTSQSGGGWMRTAGNPAAAGDVQRLNETFVMPAFGGTMAFSYDGFRWREVAVQQLPGKLIFSTDTHWKGFVWSGQRYIAAGPNYLYASTDGESWATTTPYAVLGQYRAVAWNGSQAVAVGDNGFLQTSPDGLVWTTRDTGGAAEDFFDVQWTGSRWLAVGLQRIYSSEDGEIWSERVNSSPHYLRDLVWTGTAAVATASSGVIRSSDGLTWAPATLGTGSFPEMGAIHKVGGLLYAYRYGTVKALYASADSGGNWTQVPYAEIADFAPVRPDDSQVVRLGSYLWGFVDEFPVPLGEAGPRSRTIEDLHWDGKTIVAVGSQGTIRSSSDGKVWRWHGTEATQTLSGITKSGSTWIAVGFAGRILRSEDGRIWQAVASGTTSWLRAVGWMGTCFVAVGENGTLLTSPDGLVWTPRNTSVTQELRSFCWNGNRAVVGGAAGAILTSEDGITWTRRAAPTLLNQPWVVWTGSEFYGNSMKSADGITWQTITAPSVYQSCVWTGSEFVLVAGAIWRSKDTINLAIDGDSTPWPLTTVERMGEMLVAAGTGGVIVTNGDFSNWQETQGIPSWQQGAGEDGNDDGVPNLIAFATGLPGMTPLTPGERNNLPRLVWNSGTSGWELAFGRLSNPPVGLTYRVEESLDCRTWYELGSRTATLPWPAALGVRESGTYLSPIRTVSFPVGNSQPAKTWRLKVDH